jgi:hypothetical protein
MTRGWGQQRHGTERPVATDPQLIGNIWVSAPHEQLGVVSGAVTKRAVRLRVLFHKGRPLDLVPIDGGDRFPVNFFAGFYLETGPPPAEHQPREPSIDRVIAFDQAGNRVAECRLRFGPSNTTTPWRCGPAGPTNP